MLQRGVVSIVGYFLLCTQAAMKLRGQTVHIQSTASIGIKITSANSLFSPALNRMNSVYFEENTITSVLNDEHIELNPTEENCSTRKTLSEALDHLQAGNQHYSRCR